MPITLDGSCHCGAVTFTVESNTPVPYQRCYCSICRKQQGGGGYAINLGANAASLRVEGEAKLGTYRARIADAEHERCELSGGRRRFCKDCGAALWLYDPAWPDLVHPFASAIDTPLPAPRSSVHLMLKYKADWVAPDIAPADESYALYPPLSIAEWHRTNGVWID